jgi:hypothetical protein
MPFYFFFIYNRYVYFIWLDERVSFSHVRKIELAMLNNFCLCIPYFAQIYQGIYIYISINPLIKT